MADNPGVTPANRKGHWERPQIVDWHDRIFATLGRSWHSAAHCLPLPENWCDLPHIVEIQARISGFLCNCFNVDTLFGVKDPRLARLLPLWQKLLDDLALTPIYIVPWRDPVQVARSLCARDGTKLHHGLHRWIVYHAELIAAVGPAPICLLPFAGWFDDAAAQTRRLAQYAGLPVDQAKLAGIAAEVPEPGLRHDDPSFVAASALCAAMVAALTRAQKAGVFDEAAHTLAAHIIAHEALIAPQLTETEVLRVSVAEQARVITDLQSLIAQLRGSARAA